MKHLSMTMTTAVLGVLATSAHAGLTIGQTTDLPATWPTLSGNAPTITTMAPNAGTVGITVGPGTVVSETFTATSTFTLGGLALAGSGTNGADFSIHIFEFSASGGYNPATSTGYVPSTATTGVDLLGGGSGLTFSTIGAPDDRVLTFDLTGADEITLTAGRSYAFELWNVDATDTYFFRRAADTYTGGSAYLATNPSLTTTRGSLVGGANRDAVFAAYAAPSAVPEPTTLAALGLGAAALLRRRRRA